MTDALVIKGLSKRFGGLRAVQDLSFAVKENETVALIGPNGAGKTTSFHLITGFHRADSGSVLAFGREIVGLKPHDVCALGLARRAARGRRPGGAPPPLGGETPPRRPGVPAMCRPRPSRPPRPRAPGGG